MNHGPRQDLASEPEPEEDNNLAVTIFGKEYEGQWARRIDMKFFVKQYAVTPQQVIFLLWWFFVVFLAFVKKSGLFC